jgi:hypothetical protein
MAIIPGRPIGAPAAARVANAEAPLPPNVRAGQVQTYGDAKTLNMGPNGSAQGALSICKGQFNEAMPITIYTECPGIFVNGFAAGANGYSFVEARAVIQWTDGNQSFKRDVAMGPPQTIVASLVEVSGYLSGQNNTSIGARLPQNVTPAVSGNDPRIFAKVRALIVPATATRGHRLIYTDSGGHDSTATSAGNRDRPVGPSNAGPFSLYGVWGQQISGTDLYLMIADRDGNDANGLFGLVAGDWPTLCIPAPSGKAFSLTDDDGFTFNHGFTYAWSTTPGVFTSFGATPPDHLLSTRFAFNLDVYAQNGF